MKEMIYSKGRNQRKVLAEGKYLDLQYYIMNLGTHPTAYIMLPENYKINEDEISVHGGITYSADHLWTGETKNIDGYFIGWDYAHCGDYIGFSEDLPESLTRKKWTTEEIFEEVKNVCEQIIKMKEDD